MNEKNIGIYQLQNGFLGFSLYYHAKRKEKDFKKNKDLNVNPIKTEKQLLSLKRQH